MTFSCMSRAFFRFAIALMSFLLGPRGNFNATISASVNNIKASKSICSASSTGWIEEMLFATKNRCNGVHSSSVSSPSKTNNFQCFFRSFINFKKVLLKMLPESKSSSHILCLLAKLPALPILISSLCFPLTVI